MYISDRIKGLSDKPVNLSFLGADASLPDLSVDLSAVYVANVEKKSSEINFSTSGPKEENQMIIHALAYELASILKLNRFERNAVDVTFREAENMLRDINSLPSFDESILLDIETIYQNIQKLYGRLDQLNKLLANDISSTSLVGKSFFEQLKILDKCISDCASGFGIIRGELPRLNTWNPSSGELSFIVSSKTNLNRVDTAIFHSVWTVFDGVERIKMVASESL